MGEKIQINENKLRSIIRESIASVIKRSKKGVSVNEVKYFHPNGKKMPNGSHYTRGGFLHECYVNENSFNLDEGVHPKQYGLAKYRGGMIVFSTDINAIKLDPRPVINKIKQVAETFKQRLSKGKKIHQTIFKHNQENEEFIGAYSVGRFFHGRYISDSGQKFDEKSICLEINGISSKTLLKMAEMICVEFKQETVLVKDLNNNKIYTADANPIPDDSSFEKEMERINTEV